MKGFQKIRYRLYILSEIRPYAYGVRKLFFISFLLSIISLSLTLIQPIFYKIFIEDVLLQQRFLSLLWVVSGYIFIFFISVLIGYCKTYLNNKINNRIIFRVK